MKNTFNSLPKLARHFQNEGFCRDYLAEKRWGNTPACPYCGNAGKIWRIENSKRYKCKECQKKFSVTVGTIFEDTKIKLNIWFQAIYFITTSKKGISSLQLASQLGVTQKTAWIINHKIRDMLKEKDITTLSNFVEADETYIGGREQNKHAHKKATALKPDLTISEKIKLNTGRSIHDKAVVLGIIERNGKVVAMRVPDAKAEHILPIIEKHVNKDATMLTDEWYGYGRLEQMGYAHKTIQHNLKVYAKGEVHTNTIENFWSIFKRGVYGIYHSISQKHLDRYINEFSGRFNTRNISNTERFDLILSNSEGNLSYNKLVSKNA